MCVPGIKRSVQESETCKRTRERVPIDEGKRGPTSPHGEDGRKDEKEGRLFVGISSKIQSVPVSEYQ